MISRSKKVLAMDFGSRSIKMVEGLYKKGKLNIDRTVLLDLPDGIYENGYIRDSDMLQDILSSFMRLNNIKNSDTIAVISSTDILTRDVIIPNVSDEEIEGILNYKITDYIPIEPEDYIIQYINEGEFIENGNKLIKLFIIAMPKIIAKEHFDLLRNLDLKPKVLDFQSNAMKNLLSHMIENGYETEDKTIVSIDIGFFSTKLTILKNKRIEVSRIIPIGIKDILDDLYMHTNVNVSEKELLSNMLHLKYTDLIEEDLLQIDKSLGKFLSRLYESIKMVFTYYVSQEQNNIIDLLVLQGSIVNNSKIKEGLENFLNVKTVNINSFRNILDRDLCLYANAIGSLIRGELQ